MDILTELTLPLALREQLVAAAQAAFPRECCGLVEGVVEGRAARALALHPAANLSRDADRFELDPAEQFRLLRALRGTGRDIIGCYHSHPHGRAEPSPRDLAGAAEDNFVWLIAGVAPGAVPVLAAFVAAGGQFLPVAMG